jgi:hypothetical protein
MTDTDDIPPADIPPALNRLFALLARAFDALEEATGQEIALDLFFEEVEFEGEKPRLCLTVNDLVSAYHEDGRYTVVLTLEDGEDPHPWFVRDTAEAAAAQALRLLVDAALLTDEDLATMLPAVTPRGGGAAG